MIVIFGINFKSDFVFAITPILKLNFSPLRSVSNR
jgi:hypothetical protein